MKKGFAFILIVLYGVTSFGMTLRLHYCCGKIDKVTLSSKSITTCKSKTSIHSRSCCDNKDYELKIKVDQEAGAQQLVSFSPNSLISFPAYSSSISFLQKRPLNSLFTGPPLVASFIPLFIQYCIYRV